MKDCIFCKIVKGEAPSWKVFENDSVYAFLDINPASKYHTLVIPKKHYVNIFDIPEYELREVIAVVGNLSKWYQKELRINDIQIINSNGAEAQQDVFHIHYHIVSRKLGDGQNVIWTTHPEWRTEFDDLLKRLAANNMGKS